MLRLSGVEKDYGKVRALNGIDLEVAPGEVIAIVGPSGCGKSTLLRCLNGLEEITGGQIELDGTVITGPGTRWTEVRQRVGMVFQSYELFPHLNVLDNLLLGPRLVQKRNQDQAGEEALRLLTRVGLAEKAKALPRELSGGQKQRVAIVRALMMHPEMLLLDEITASLDPEIVREVLDVVLELAADGMTMLIVTHEMPFARAIADRVVLMDAGRIVEVAPPEKFFIAPETERAKAFLKTFEFDSVHRPGS
ncbi:amino acid ABC transporter ATP-binding protein [Arachnia rubra]|uniref:Amino acid ABC transporter ATP-binding protein n=2 Tax=Arachnia rubra TaxID=1547448 RepID=A0ABX7Y8Q4_9ACTN|nr:amino acid ABC transporter ATP-binding protein [Propionibacterium sp.]QUC09607.1 amino acid ABC transporter ATP-binding protein [Arachnia rubra]